jgi:hypothetical protein
MQDAQYRPRSASEIVDAGFQLLRRDYRSFVTITAVTYAPVLVVLLVLQRALGVTMREPNVRYLMASVVLTLLWYSLSAGALTFAAADAYAGRAVDPVLALRRGLSRMPATLVAMLAVYVAVAVSLGLVGVLVPFAAVGVRLLPLPVLIVGGIAAFGLLTALALYLLTRWFAVPAAHLLEDTGPFAGMRRSWRLSDDSKWRLFGTLLLVWVIYFVLTIGLSVAGAILQNVAIQQVMGALAAVLVYPLLPVTMTVLYYDARIRREGYDIDLLERELGAASPGTTSPEQPAY